MADVLMKLSARNEFEEEHLSNTGFEDSHYVCVGLTKRYQKVDVRLEVTFVTIAHSSAI